MIHKEQAVFGFFTRQHLTDFKTNHELSNADITALKKIPNLKKEVLEYIVGIEISNKTYYWIKELGLSVGPFLEANFPWEIPALVVEDPLQYNYYEVYIHLAFSTEVESLLNADEIRFVRDLSKDLQMNLCRSNHRSFLKIKEK